VVWDILHLLTGRQTDERGQTHTSSFVGGNNFCTQSGYFTISNVIFKFNFPAVVVSEISGDPTFTLGGLRFLDAT